MQDSYLTSEGAERLRKELEELKGTAREQLAKRLRAAIQHGDLSENADYINAKEEQGFLEGRIMELETLLKHVVIIDDLEHNPEEVGIGDRITVQEEDLPQEIYYIVGPEEANPENGRISYESPIGSALLGHRVGDEIIVKAPGGDFRIKILCIQ
jgi:transcription elongation factor GreA